ncbi:hypothetical protein [Paenibacillus sp. MMS18-CY102]|uniref:hypothetical protein n=1 Tax=Paenibacillus sp. MMS18-CY102 TaxID=2682849 RepID=UPI0013664373|nr:hypothetical protein [Paenibacillus sp. MMS18-CY102]MWC27833.1 hypothetical protein [Paenibacillus sp. MMS18-CY102]
MKKILILYAVVASLAAGSSAVYAQANNSGMDIIIGVESGKLPRSDINRAREFLLNRADIFPEIIKRYGI